MTKRSSGSPSKDGQSAKKQRTDGSRSAPQPAAKRSLDPQAAEFSKQFGSPEDSIKWLLANSGMSVSDFFKNVWEHKHLKMAASSENQTLANIFGKSWFSELLRKSGSAGSEIEELSLGEDFSIERYARGKAEDYETDDVALSVETLDKALADKYSVQVMQPERYQAALHAFMEPLETHFGSLVSARGLIQPAGGQFQGPRVDNTERFVVQTEGEQVWQVYATKNKFALDFNDELSEADIGQPVETVTLRAGDVLYLPRGAISQAKAAAGGVSYSVEFSVYDRQTTFDYLADSMAQILDSYKERCEPLRRDLPIGFLPHCRAMTNKDLANSLTQLADAIRKDSGPVPSPEGMLVRFMTGRLPPFGVEIQMEAEEPPAPNSKVQLRSKTHVSYFVRQNNGDEDDMDEEMDEEAEENDAKQDLGQRGGAKKELVVLCSVLNSVEAHCMESAMVAPDFADVAFSIDGAYEGVMEKLFKADTPLAVVGDLHVQDLKDSNGKPIDVLAFVRGLFNIGALKVCS